MKLERLGETDSFAKIDSGNVRSAQHYGRFDDDDLQRSKILWELHEALLKYSLSPEVSRTTSDLADLNE